MAYRQVHDDPGPPSARRPGLSAKIDLVTGSLLAKDPATGRPGRSRAGRARGGLAPDQTAVLDPYRAAPPNPVRRRAGHHRVQCRPFASQARSGHLAAVGDRAGHEPGRGAGRAGGGADHQPGEPGARDRAAAAVGERPAQPLSRTVGHAESHRYPDDHARRSSGPRHAARSQGIRRVRHRSAGRDGGRPGEPGAGGNLINQFNQLMFNTPRDNPQQLEQQYAQLVEIYDQYRSQGQITGRAALMLRQEMDALGTALGTG